MKQSTRPQATPDFFSFSETLIQELIDDGRYGTSQTYSKATASFKTFLLQQSADPDGRPALPIESVDDILIYKYNRYLSKRGLIRNSISFYNRVLQAIYNKAVKRYRIPDLHPFADVFTGVEKTRNRAVSEVTIARLVTLDLSYDKSLETARDIFIFSYVTRGMPFVDMAYLRKSDVKGNRISYTRKKTGTRMDVRVESQVKRLLSKYDRPDSEFLLPILQGTDSESSEAQYLHYQSCLTAFNKKLKELSKIVKCGLTLTSYVARHSWATAARNNEIPMSTISEGLGHSSERMTRIYLATFSERLIDNANRKLVGRLKKFVSLQETNRAQRYI